jgi:hypothetical protein
MSTGLSYKVVLHTCEQFVNIVVKVLMAKQYCKKRCYRSPYFPLDALKLRLRMVTVEVFNMIVKTGTVWMVLD